MKIKPLNDMTMLHLANNRKVYFTKGKVYAARWGTTVPGWETKQTVFAKLSRGKYAPEFMLIGSEYEFESISRREHAQKNKAKHLNALALFWRCHVEHGKPQGWIAEHKPTATNECIGAWLYRKLALLERRAHRAAENLCNITDYQAKCDRILEKVTSEVRNLFGGKLPAGFRINRDPCGYSLKLDCGPLRRHAATPAESLDGLRRDWGGDFVLAPSLFN